jgi:hypothetical protein
MTFPHLSQIAQIDREATSVTMLSEAPLIAEIAASPVKPGYQIDWYDRIRPAQSRL